MTAPSGTATAPGAPLPFTYVPKSNGKIRICVDFVQLNKVTKKDAYPRLRDESSRQRLINKQIFSTGSFLCAKTPLRKLSSARDQGMDYGNSQSCPMGSLEQHRPANEAWTKFLRTVLIITLMTVLYFQMTYNPM